MFGDMGQFYANLQNALKVLEDDDRREYDTSQKDKRQEKHDAILNMVAECIQKSCEMNRSVEFLTEENQRLTNKYNYEKVRSRTLQQKLKKILKNQDLFSKMKEEYQAMSNAMKDQKLIIGKDRSSATFTSIDKYVQVSNDCTSCTDRRKSSAIFNNSTQTDDAMSWHSCEMDTLSSVDVDRLDDDVNTLKELLNERELIWGKLATRERIQRLQLNRMTIELEEMRQVEMRQKTELEVKEKVLHDLTRDLEEERIQIRRLKKLATKQDK